MVAQPDLLAGHRHRPHPGRAGHIQGDCGDAGGNPAPHTGGFSGVDAVTGLAAGTEDDVFDDVSVESRPFQHAFDGGGADLGGTHFFKGSAETAHRGAVGGDDYDVI